ncbi:MAG: hypothetical protein ACRELF_07415 [Gemmataceae bacterium]
MSSEKLTVHLRVDRYGDFLLTDAIRPALHVPVVPRQGFRVDVYRDAQLGLRVPVLVAAISREQLFDVFLALLAPLGDDVKVILETSHHSDHGGHKDLYREHIDLPVLMSYFCDFEDLLLNDGYTGVAVLARGGPMEVQFDEHKLLVVYARDLAPFKEILRDFGIACDDALRLITEGEHLHSSDPEHFQQFEQLCFRLGIGEPVEHVNW